jgi:hypothetical protein
MEKVFDDIKTIRAAATSLTAHLTLEQLNKVPDGFANNIIWNLGHMIAAQQGLCYKRGNAPLVVEESFFETYKPGTTPTGFVDEAGVEEIKTLILSTIYQLEQDYNEEKFSDYPTFTTRYGVEISSIEEAIKFLTFHDGLHMGYIMALKRAIN